MMPRSRESALYYYMICNHENLKPEKLDAGISLAVHHSMLMYASTLTCSDLAYMTMHAH